MAIKLNSIKFRSLLKVYTVFIFVLIGSIPVLFLTVEHANSQVVPQTCSGEIGSGQSCSGNPGIDKTWSCRPNSNSPTGYYCVAEDYGSCTFTDTDGQIKNCNCGAAIQQCRNACLQANAGNPGTHTYSDPSIRCAGCGQIVGCGCTVVNNSCPYADGNNSNREGQAVIRYRKNPNEAWQPSINLVCGERFYVGALLTDGGGLGTNVTVNINGTNYNSDNIAIDTPNNSTTYNINLTIPNTSGGSYTETQCRATASISCSPNVVTPTPTNTPTPTLTVTPTITNTPTVTPTTPYSCNAPCQNSCGNGLQCHNGRCRDPRWLDEVDCRVDYAIDKQVLSGNNSNAPATVVYRIIMTNNTSNVTFNNVPFEDTFNPAQLVYVSARGSRTGGPQNVALNLNGSSSRVFHSNLATILGNLAPGQSYTIDVTFTSPYAGSNICNTARWNPQNYGYMSDQACLRVNAPDTDL